MTTRYVSLAGSDSNTGTLASPFKTFAKANAVSVDGDALFGRQFDIFRETVYVARNHITLGSYGGSGNCILAADNVVTGFITSSLSIFKVAMPTQPLMVFVGGVRASNGGSSTSLSNHQWFWSSGVLYFRNDAGNPDTHGLLIEASQRDRVIDSNGKTNLMIRGLLVRRGQHTTAGSIYMKGAGTLDGYDFDDLTVEDSLASGLFFNALSGLGHLTNSVFRRNGQIGAWYSTGKPGYTNQTLNNIQAYGNGWSPALFFGSGIVGSFRSGDIGQLLLYDNGAGGSLHSSHGFYQSDSVDPGLTLNIHDIHAYNNLNGTGLKLTGDCKLSDVYVHDCPEGGINCGPNEGTENCTQILNRIRVANCASTSAGGIYVDKKTNTGSFTFKAYHVTLYHNSTGSSAGELTFASPMAAIDVRNMVTVVNGAGSKAVRMVAQSGSVTVDHNDYFNIDSSAFVYAGTPYSLANWKLRSFAPDAHSLNADPRFVNAGAGDFTPQVTSPLIDAGIHIAGIDDGFLDAAPDIGAIEVGGGSTSISATVSSTPHGLDTAASVTVGSAPVPITITANVSSHPSGVASEAEATVSQPITADVSSTFAGVRSLVDATHAQPITADVASTMGGVASAINMLALTPITADVTSEAGGVASAVDGGFGLAQADFGGTALTEAVAAGDQKLYRGFELYVEEPAWIADGDAMVERRVYRLDNPVGRVVERARTPVAKSDIAFAWHMDTRIEIDRFFDFLYMRRGMLEPVWMPSWKHDLWLVSDAASDATTLTIEACGYTSRMFVQESRRHLILLDPQNAYVIRRVTASVDNGNGTETLTLEHPLGKAFFKRKTEICFLLLVRQSSDDAEMEQHNIDFYTSVIHFTEVPEELVIEPFGSSGKCITDEVICGAPLDLVDRGWTITGDAGTDVDWRIGGGGIVACAIQYGTTIEQTDVTEIDSASEASFLYTGFDPFAQVRITVTYKLEVVLATSVFVSVSSGARTRRITGDTASLWNTIAVNAVADASGNVEVRIGVSGQSSRNPSGTLILEYLLLVDAINICTTRLLMPDTGDVENPTWATGYPVAVGAGSMDYRWLGSIEAQEIAIEISDTEMGTYTVLALFGDGAHVPNGDYVDSSFPAGTSKWARVRMSINGVYLYSDSVNVIYGNSGNVAPVFVDASPKVVQIDTFTFVTRSEWTLGSAANAVKVYAQRINFAGLVPVLVHTETNPAAILAGTFDLPGEMVFMQLGAVYPDGEVKTAITAVTP